MTYAPIVLFIYNRPSHTQQTLEALSKNKLASESDLFIYSDGPKENATPEQLEKIKQTRGIARSKEWCKTVTIIESEKNKGLAASIISGVTEIVNKYGKIIVLEDDIVTGIYFLEFMNTALEKFEAEKKVWHITGYRYPIKHSKTDYSFFYPVMDCWGWATWSDRWSYFKKDALYYKSTFTKKMIHSFSMDGADSNKWEQIEANISGKMNTWAVFWGASIFEQKGLCLAPCVSLVKNIGFDNSGEHSKAYEKYLLDLFDINYNRITHFPVAVIVDKSEYQKNKRYIFWHKLTLMSIIGKLIPEIIKAPIRNYIFQYHKQRKD